MAGVLEPLMPLVRLLEQADDPLAAAVDLGAAVAGGTSAETLLAWLAGVVTDGALARSVLLHAGVLDERGMLDMPRADRALAQVEAVVAARADRWELVLTVPAFLRRTLDELVRAGALTRPRETTATLADVATQATSCLRLAAPFLHASTVGVLLPHARRVLGDGGRVLILTRALSLAAPERSSANVDAVRMLRDATDGVCAGGQLVVRSWEGSGLGMHFKVVVGDEDVAYVGSANPTPGGAAGHAEAGALLRGPQVEGLARWLDAVADELGRRRLEPR
jgi:hypothetical protein